MYTVHVIKVSVEYTTFIFGFFYIFIHICVLCGLLFSGSEHLQTDRLVAKFMARLFLTFYDMAHSFDKKHSFSFKSIKIYTFCVCVCVYCIIADDVVYLTDCENCRLRPFLVSQLRRPTCQLSKLSRKYMCFLSYRWHYKICPRIWNTYSLQSGPNKYIIK